MQKCFSTRHLPIALLALLIEGCATERPAPVQAMPIISGEQMLRDSQAMAHLNERWKNGKQMVERGNGLVRDGQIKIDEGNRLIDEGTKIVHESEESYKNIKQ
ncbi:MAG: hypothetical protein Q8N96_07710 [Methylovulum sp.]|nr:hypothetical protein [Methylovulum sp.]